MTTRDYELIARVIKFVPISKQARNRVIHAFEEELAVDNHRFDPLAFRIAASEIPTDKHKFMPYPHNRYSSCVRCGRLPNDEVHKV